MIHMELMFVKFKFLLFFLCIAIFPSIICWKDHLSPLERGRHEHRENTIEDKGRDQGDGAAISQRWPKVVSKPSEARQEARDKFVFTALRKNQPCSHLDLRLLPELWDNFVVQATQPVVLLYGSPRKQIQLKQLVSIGLNLWLRDFF